MTNDFTNGPVQQIVRQTKSCAQVESFVRQQAVIQNSGGLKPNRSRVCRLIVRFTPEEHESVVIQAEMARMTISQYSRLMLLRRSSLDLERNAELRKANFRLLKIGINLNQVAKHLNGGQTTAEDGQSLLAIIRRPLLQAISAVRDAMADGRTYEDQ